ncbi:MAG: hypothetical protein WCX82_01135 [archaeon]|jgi:hypothetical protein
MFDLKKIVVVFSLVLLIGTIYADVDGLFDDPKDAKEQYNSQMNGLPSSLKNFIGNEKILLNIIDGENVKSITLVFKDAVLDSYYLDNSVSPTLIVNVPKETANRILESNNKIQELKIALKTKEITYNSVGFFKKIKFGFARFALNFVK